MRTSVTLAICGWLALAAPVRAGDQSVDAAIGGAVGGGLGAYIGNEVGGREGAVVGGALGAAAGAAVATDGDGRYRRAPAYAYPRTYYGAPPGRFCPPGLAKQGRCW